MEDPHEKPLISGRDLEILEFVMADPAGMSVDQEAIKRKFKLTDDEVVDARRRLEAAGHIVLIDPSTPEEIRSMAEQFIFAHEEAIHEGTKCWYERIRLSAYVANACGLAGTPEEMELLAEMIREFASDE